MADEEKYLWMFTFRFHGENRMWWAYFRDEQEAGALMEQLVSMLPCMELLSKEGYPHGLLVFHSYFHHSCESQERADALLRGAVSARNECFFPLAPVQCDYLVSFASSLQGIRCCSQCVGGWERLRRNTIAVREKVAAD